MTRSAGIVLALALVFMIAGVTAVNAQDATPAGPTPPDVDLGISPGTRTITWEGDTAEFTIRTTAVNGYDGDVTLELCSPPRGISGTFSPQRVPAGETATLTITTAAGRLAFTEVELLIGAYGDRERTACRGGERGVRDTIAAAVIVQRTNGDFVAMDAPISESSMAACETDDAIIATRARSAGNTGGVEFLENGRRIGTRVAPGVAWAISPGCRAAYVVTADSEGEPAAVNLYNLGLPASLTLQAVGGQRVNIPYVPTEVYFSPDDTLVAVVSEVTDEDGETEQVLQVYDLIGGGQVGTNRPFNSPIDRMDIINNRINILLESGRGLSALNVNN
ncbi:MAG: hypothetical protein AAF787_05725 [Chloroflexota bacterium]